MEIMLKTCLICGEEFEAKYEDYAICDFCLKAENDKRK